MISESIKRWQEVENPRCCKGVTGNERLTQLEVKVNQRPLKWRVGCFACQNFALSQCRISRVFCLAASRIDQMARGIFLSSDPVQQSKIDRVAVQCSRKYRKVVEGRLTIRPTRGRWYVVMPRRGKGRKHLTG